MNSTNAKNQAVSTTLGLIAIAFVVAFFASFYFQQLLPLIKEDNVNIEILINFLVAFGLLGFSAWFSWDRVHNTVTAAIDQAAEELAAKERQKAEEQRIRREQEYCCAIPVRIRRGELEFPLPSDICIGFTAREAVTKALADKDEVLREIALGGIQLALNDLGREVSKENLELFHDDIYAYLKAWLMFSIRYERDMPIEYIKQRYPKDRLPDTATYKLVIENIRDRLIVPALKEHLDKKLDVSQKNQAIQITIQRLNNLATKIEINYSNN